MSLFKFNRNPSKSADPTVNYTTSNNHPRNGSSSPDNVPGATDGPPEVSEQLFVEYENPDSNRSGREETQQPRYDLARLYIFLDQNLEKKGYEDALTNPDTHYMKQQTDSIRNQLIFIISRAKTYYCAHLKDIEFHVETRKRQNLMELVAELETHRAKIEDEQQTVQSIENEVLKEGWPCQNLVNTYTRGFLNGFAAITYGTILSKRNP